MKQNVENKLMLESTIEPFDMAKKDKVEFSFLGGGKYLKIETKCYDGAKENENLIVIENNEITKPLFEAVIKMMIKK
ncbi:MAG: hypothetical protein IJ809_00140 [Clostridia bacterium]|nr:hypothetical protein [Clostridia bacterium]